jgi:hypothetical protein
MSATAHKNRRKRRSNQFATPAAGPPDNPGMPKRSDHYARQNPLGDEARGSYPRKAFQIFMILKLTCVYV